MRVIETIRRNIPSSNTKNLTPNEVAGLEAMLEEAFVPVIPRKDFVTRLNRQLITSAPLARKQPYTLAVPDQRSRDNLLIGAATLLGAAAIFATGFRVAITVLGTIGILVQWLNRKPLDEQPPVRTMG